MRQKREEVERENSKAEYLERNETGTKVKGAGREESGREGSEGIWNGRPKRMRNREESGSRKEEASKGRETGKRVSRSSQLQGRYGGRGKEIAEEAAVI